MSDADLFDERAGRDPIVMFAWLLPTSLASLVGAQMIWEVDPSPDWSSLAIAGLVAAAVGVVVLVTKTGRDHQVWLGALGLLFIALGADTTWQRHGEPRLNWSVTGFGLALLLAAIAWALDRRWRIANATARMALAELLLLGVGFILLAITHMGVAASSQFSSVGTPPGQMGRPRRHRGRRVWSAAASRTPRSVHEVWERAAIEEHESVEAFTTLAARLRAVGAPTSLVDRCMGAASDEVRHARTCRRIAHQLGGEARIPVHEATSENGAHADAPAGAHAGRVAREIELVRLAVESLEDGVVGEGLSARLLATGAISARAGIDAPVRSMASDEARHAELGRDIVLWCLEASPTLVGAALQATTRRLDRTRIAAAPHHAIPARDLRRNGLVDADLANDIATEHRAESLHWMHSHLAFRL